MRQVFAPGALLQGLTRAIAWTVWLCFALYFTGLAPAVLGVPEETQFAVGRQHISLLLILQAALSAVTAVLIALDSGAMSRRG